LIGKQTDVRLVPNQSEKGKYNLILLRFNKISLCARAFQVQSIALDRLFTAGYLLIYIPKIIFEHATLGTSQFTYNIQTFLSIDTFSSEYGWKKIIIWN